MEESALSTDIFGHSHVYFFSLHLYATSSFMPPDRLAGLVVKASASRTEDPRFESRLCRDFSGSSHTSDFKIGTPVATLPGAWRHRISSGTGWHGVNILWLGEVASLICNFYLSVAASKLVWATELYTKWSAPRGIAEKGLMRERDGAVPPYLNPLFLRAVSAAAHSRVSKHGFLHRI